MRLTLILALLVCTANAETVRGLVNAKHTAAVSNSNTNADWNDLIAVMNSYFGTANCITEGVEGSIGYSCSITNQTGLLESIGSSSTTAIPSTFQVCYFGTQNTKFCNQMDYRDVYRDEAATSTLLQGPNSGATKEWVSIQTAMTNHFSEGSCTTLTTSYDSIMACSQPGQTATLKGSAGPNSIPFSLVSCLDQSYAGPSCNTLDFFDVTGDVQQAKNLLNFGI